MGTSVGVVSLDLVIKENLQKQLDGFKQKITDSLTKPLESTSQNIQDNLQKPIKQADESINKLGNSLKSTAKKASKIGIPKIEVSGDESKVIDEMNEIMNKITESAEKPAKKIKESFSGISEELRQMIGNFEVPETPTAILEQNLEHTQEQISLTQKKWQELKAQLSDLSDEDISLGIGDKIQAERIKVEKQLMALQANAKKYEEAIAQESLQSVPNFESTFEKLKYAFSEIWEGCKLTTKKAMSEIGSFVIAPFKGIANTIISPFRAAKNGIVKLFSNLKYYLENPLQAVKKVGSKVFSSIKNVGSKAFNSLKSVAGKALNGIKGTFSKLHGSVGSLEKPVNKLGRSIKNAFRRVFVMAGILALVKAFRSAITNACNGNDEFAKSLNAIKANLNIAFEPIKSTIMPYINALMQGLAKVTQTVAAFINSLFGTTYQKSLNTLKKAQKANKDAAKEAKTYLASFDEMNVAQDTSSSDSGSSGDDSGVDYSAINGDNVKLPDWAERMKDAIRAGDWKSVGALIAEKINNAFTGINWGKIQSKVNGFMKGVADGLNGFVKKLKWKQLGKAFANGINTIFGGMYTFMKTFDWGALGKGIADFFNGAIEDADWELIGRTLASRITAVVDTLYAFVTNFDFSAFGASIGESVNAWFDEIDWAKLGETISESIKGLFDTIMGFLETVDWQGIGEKLWTLVKSIDWGGIAVKLFKTLGEAIGAAVAVLWGFIKEAVHKIGDYFKGKMDECGGNVIKGLLKGLVDGVKGIYTWIKEHIFKPFIEGFKKVFGIHSPSKVMGEMGGFLIDGLLGAIKSGIALIKKVFQTMVATIKSIITPIADFFKNLFSGIFGSIKDILGGIIQFIKGIFTGNWSSAWDGVKKIFKGVWDGLVTVVKAPINLIIGAVNAMLGAVENGINWIIDGINKLSFDIPDWVPVVGGETFGFDIPTVDIPEIPKLATGGLATAPTLAMVGDNRNARTDPEVIAPLSKLQGMLTDGAGISEIIALLREIVDILKSLDLTFEGKINERTLWKAIVKLYREHKVRTGGALI